MVSYEQIKSWWAAYGSILCFLTILVLLKKRNDNNKMAGWWQVSCLYWALSEIGSVVERTVSHLYSHSQDDTDQRNQILQKKKKKSQNFPKVKIVNLNQIYCPGQGWGSGATQVCLTGLLEDHPPTVFSWRAQKAPGVCTNLDFLKPQMFPSLADYKLPD